jgi:hypothetical protein
MLPPAASSSSKNAGQTNNTGPFPFPVFIVCPTELSQPESQSQRSNLPTLRDFIVIFKRQEICL